MQERTTDALEMLLPDAAPAFWQRAQRVTTFLRLLSDDARGHGGQSVAVSLPRARSEFDRSAQARRIRIHEELLRHHLYALVGADSFAHCGECDGTLQQAWSELEEERGDSLPIAHVSVPGESAESVAERLLVGLEQSGAGTAHVALWRARLLRAAQGPESGAAAFERFLAQSTNARAGRAEHNLRGAGLAGLVECLLDRAAVRAARARLEADGSRALADPRLRRLLSWTRVLCGDERGARSLQSPELATRARLPRPLAELRARVPATGPWLYGQVCTQEALLPARDLQPSTEPVAAANAARAQIGAALFAAFVLESPGRARLVAHSLAPALRGRWNAWLESREGACADASEGESQLLADARTRFAHFGAMGNSDQARHSIDPESIQARALVPVCNSRGDVCGWLDLQFEHQLVASQARLERLAHAWSQRLAPRAASDIATIPTQIGDENSFQATVLRGFVDALALKTTLRRWSAFDVQGNAVILVAAGGGALEGGEETEEIPQPASAAPVSESRRSEGRAVARAISTGRSVVFGEAERQLALHPEAMSGVAVPLRLRGRVAGVWLVESTRRRDFSAADVQRFEARAAALAPELAAAQFRSWHGARFGHDVYVSASNTLAGLSADQLVALAGSRSPVALSGPRGSGRRMLARRLHFEGPNRAEPLRRISADLREIERALALNAEPAGWIVEGLLEQPHALQVQIAQLVAERSSEQALDRRASAARIFFLLDPSIAGATEQGQLAPELAWSLSRVELKLAPLAGRRHEIAPLAQLFARHFAAEEGVRSLQLDDTALGFLWRQNWNGNVRELAQWMYRLVLCHADGVIDAGVLEGLAQRFGQDTLQRIPSRHPDRELLQSALDSTATPRGGWNKTRAAIFLGWDTDTLQSRIVEAGLLAGSAGSKFSVPIAKTADEDTPAAGTS